MKEKILHVDAFTKNPFTGNPAAVCFPKQDRGDDWLQSVAAEMNLSETAFLQETDDGYRLRWFTPTVEVDLCGHATLASAHVLFSEGCVTEDSIRFQTRSGVLTAKKRGEWIELDFPTHVLEDAVPPQELIDALGAHPIASRKISFAYLLEVGSEEEVRGLAPDYRAMIEATDQAAMVTARSSNADYDFVSRFFAPFVGIDEDPVTGSAHCALGPYWMQQLGKTEFLAYQASNRGGVVGVQVEGERTKLRGQAVTVLRGELG
ncbi:MAG: PhzF family phenazine biosynthesis isomerase [Candidatus Omnitrophica bacterium]|nr:PhzF family phenazine biosynthesis isomerase [Candidatus Omnitrophota bacterium]